MCSRVVQCVVPWLIGLIVISADRLVKYRAVDQGPQIEYGSVEICGKFFVKRISKQIAIMCRIARNLNVARQAGKPRTELERQILPPVNLLRISIEQGHHCDTHEIIHPAFFIVVSLSIKLMLSVLRHHTNADQIAVDEVCEFGV